MKGIVCRFLPANIAGQIAMLVVASIVIAHLLITATFFFLGPQRPLENPEIGTISGLAFMALLLDSESDAAKRTELLQAALKIDPNLKWLQRLPQAESRNVPPGLAAALKAQFGDRIVVLDTRNEDHHIGDPTLLVAARLVTGGVLATPLPLDPVRIGIFSPVIIGTLIFLASAIALLSLWAARALTSPLTKFADSAEQFTLHNDDPPLAERGPSEVKRLARALNGMQARIRELVEARTRMLAAVSHDLRTPITRMRLRAEDIENRGTQGAFIRDLDSMQNLIQSCLSFLRGGTTKPNVVATDLASLVQTVCDESDDVRQCIDFRSEQRPYIACDPDQLKRAIVNVIDNALKYGEHVVVVVRGGTSTATITIQDDGPGIPDSEKARVLEPFYRGDTARDLNTQNSFGLGLSIAQSIVESHQGRLELVDAKPSGLIVTITLPQAALTKSGMAA